MGKGIGSLSENELHRDLIAWYANPHDHLETEVDGYIIDIVRAKQLIELQTSGFSKIRKKLEALLIRHPVHLIHPIQEKSWIIKLNPLGETISRRKSPKSGSVYNIFAELVAFPTLIDHPNFSLELLLIQAEDLRQHDPKGPWRRRGWRVVNRRLVNVGQSYIFTSSKDFNHLLPASLPELFSTADIAKHARITRRLAQQMAYCLRSCEVITIQSKNRQGFHYTRGF